VRSCRPERAREVVPAVDADLSRPSLEFLKDIRPGAGGQRERSACFIGGEREGLFNEKRPPRSRRRRLADHRAKVAPGTTAVVDGDVPGRERDQNAPGGRGKSRPVRGDPALVTVGPPGKSDMQPQTPLSAARAAEDWKDGARSGQRPASSNGFDPTCVRAWPSPGDVIVQEHDKRLACGYSGGGGSSGNSEDAAKCRRDQRRCQRRTPPASAGGVRDIDSPAGHPVNWDGPWRGWSTAAAQAR
jgi:hypothetical protein